MSVKRSRNLPESFSNAGAGVVYALRTQRNMRVHFLLGILVLLLALVVELSPVELAVLVLTIAGVMAAELVNTAIETVVDLVSPQYHPLAKVAKNVAAGAVLVTAGTSVLVGYLLFAGRFAALQAQAQTSAAAPHASPYLTLIGVGLVMLAAAGLKAWPGPLSRWGAMPSGQAALAFALATAIFLTARSLPVALPALAIALMVGGNRIQPRGEGSAGVVTGACLGVVLMLLVFRLMG